MKLIHTLIISAFLILPTVCSADAGSQREAEKLLEIMDLESLLKQTMNQMLDVQIQQNPSLAPFKNVMIDFFDKYMSYESLKPEMVKIYGDTFTESELKEINAFYSTPTGAKAIQTMPQLMAQGSQIGVQRVQNNIGELQMMIKEEAAKLQAQEEAKAAGEASN